MRNQPPFDPNFSGPNELGIYNADPNAAYVNGNPSTGQRGSIPPMEAVVHQMKELVHLIEHSAQTPTAFDLEQVRKAIRRMIGWPDVIKPVGPGVPVYQGVDNFVHEIRSLVEGPGIKLDLVEYPAGSGDYGIRISLAGSSAAVGGGTGAPPPTSFAAGKTIFDHTGADQSFTIPTGATWLRIKGWGAAGGGVGGYALGVWQCIGDLIPGNVLKIMVGGAYDKYINPSYPGAPYGFGGAYIPDDEVGPGGLTGAFIGNTAIAATDLARALIIAGGGGGIGGGSNTGESGGDPVTAGGSLTMQGATGSGNNGSGGGGYSGGLITSQGWGRGGTNFARIDASYAVTSLYTPRVNTFTSGGAGDLLPPNSADSDRSNAGTQRIMQSGHDTWAIPGRLVVEWSVT